MGYALYKLIDLCFDESDGVTLFTDDGKLLSQDCYHLTRAGAKWFAKKIKINNILKLDMDE